MPNSFSNSFRLNVKKFGKLRDASGDPAYRDDLVESRIAGLLKSRLPSAILRFISSIIVNSPKCSVNRPWSHVAKEIGKGTQPLANHYAPPPVKVIAFPFWIVASLNHLFPASVRSAFLSDNSVSMLASYGVSLVRHNVGLFNVVFSGGLSVSSESRRDYCNQTTEGVN